MTEERFKELVRRAKEGQVAAFEELVKEHKQGLFAFALGMTGGDHHAAADILQEAFLKAFLNIAKFRGDCSFMTWLWRIARNEFFNFRTSPKTSGTVQEENIEEREHEEKSIDEKIAEDQRRENLYRLLGMLSEEHREVISLIDLQELTYEEAATILGISESALKSRVFRARENLFSLAVEHKKLFL